jgi:hypothetical protein
VYDSTEEEEGEEDAALARMPLFSAGDYVHDDQEEDAVIAQVAAVFEAEARTRRRQEEPEVVRQVHEYEVAR